MCVAITLCTSPSVSSCPLLTQVRMRENFALPHCNIIRDIEEAILNDASVRDEFFQLLPTDEDRKAFGQDFFELFVTRLKNLHGTETAAQLCEQLASAKRITDSHKRKALSVNAKHEQLRAAKKKRK